MAASAVTNLPDGYSLEQPAQQQAATSLSSLPAGYSIESSPDQSGEATNDVGATVIVPKDGESYADTVQRAIARAKQNPDAVQADIAKEATPKNLATKSAETLGAAAGIGVMGPATLAAVGEAGAAASDYALKVIGSLPKEGAVSWLEQHGSGLLGMAARHPEVMKLAARLGIDAATLLLGGKALHSMGVFGGK